MDGVTASIDDCVVGGTGGGESGTKDVNVSVLIVGLVVLTVRSVLELSWNLGPGVPSSDIGGNTSQLRGLSGSGVGKSELLGTGC